MGVGLDDLDDLATLATSGTSPFGLNCRKSSSLNTASVPTNSAAVARNHVYASDMVIVSADDDMLGERVLKESFEREF
jgi:hypothetical protein